MGFSFLLVTFLLLKCPWLPRCTMVKKSPADAEEVGDTGLVPGQEKPLEEEMATHSSILTWEVP